MRLVASIVDGQALVKLVWVGAASGVGVTAAFGIALLGATRAADLSRAGRPAEAVLYAALGVAGLAIMAAAVIYGIVVMTTKS